MSTADSARIGPVSGTTLSLSCKGLVLTHYGLLTDAKVVAAIRISRIMAVELLSSYVPHGHKFAYCLICVP